uniref:Uncharacterized protein n=1 Tax=Knipowitschia caucasica TaxID=637954 RepID=A0AAV2M8B2_KNICA
MRTCHGLILDISGPEPHAQSGTGTSPPAAALRHTSPLQSPQPRRAQATPSLQSHINTKIWRDHNGDWHRQVRLTHQKSTKSKAQMFVTAATTYINSGGDGGTAATNVAYQTGEG